MTAVDTSAWVDCPTCHYPHDPQLGCDNPACPANPRLTREQVASLIARVDAYRAEQAARAESARLWGSSFRRTRS